VDSELEIDFTGGVFHGKFNRVFLFATIRQTPSGFCWMSTPIDNIEQCSRADQGSFFNKAHP